SFARQKEIRSDIAKANEIFSDLVLEYKNDIDKRKGIESLNKMSEYLEKKLQDEISESSIILVRLALLSRIKNKKIIQEHYFDFEYVIFSQSYVMLYSLFEAYLTDVIEIICLSKPELIEQYLGYNIKNKTNAQHLIENFIPLVIDKIGSSIEKRINFFEKISNLGLNLKEDQFEMLKFSEQIRHLFLHKGGYIDSKFLTRTNLVNDSKFAINNKLILTHDLLKAFYYIWNEFFIILSNKVFTKYLEV
ncbi:MAG: hypothetical protein ACFFDW_12100, partial [Candidatus Thorarchaeota archaeon]